MRKEGVVAHQLKQVLYRHLQRLLKENFKKVPVNCLFNGEIDPRAPRMCMYKVNTPDWNSCVCDSSFGGDVQARSCPFWAPKRSSEELKKEFKEFVATATRSEIASLFPDAAALMWVLDQDGSELDLESVEEQPHSEESVPLAESWADRFMSWVRGNAGSSSDKS